MMILPLSWDDVMVLLDILTFVPTGPAVKICVKFSLVLINAVRIGSPSPLSGCCPTSIISCAIAV